MSCRLVSLKLSNLYNGYRQGELALDDRPDLSQQRRTLARVVDALRQEHGEDVVLHSHNLRLREGPRDAAQAVAPRVPVRSYNPQTSALVRCVPLNVRSYYCFLDSTLSPKAIVQMAVKHGPSAVPQIWLAPSVWFPRLVDKAKHLLAGSLAPDFAPAILPPSCR